MPESEVLCHAHGRLFAPEEIGGSDQWEEPYSSFDLFGSVCPSARTFARFKWLLMIPLTRYYKDQGELVSVISSRSLLPWSVGEIFG